MTLHRRTGTSLHSWSDRQAWRGVRWFTFSNLVLATLLPMGSAVMVRASVQAQEVAPEAAPTCVATSGSAGDSQFVAAGDGRSLSSSLDGALEEWLTVQEPQLVAAASQRPFPEIHERARQANVPVIMYHDVLAEKQVFFDLTPEELEADFQFIQEQGLTPISLDDLVRHLSTGSPLPQKPILLSFDDGYEGHYTYVYPLLKKYSFPATFGIYPSKVGTRMGRSSLTWDQLQEMAADPLVTIASHSVTHPTDLRVFDDQGLRRELVESKRILEERLGIPIDHFVYPAGHYDERVQHWAQLAGYHSALTMNDDENLVAGQSSNLLSIERIGQSQLERVADAAYGGPPMALWSERFDFTAPIQVNRTELETVPLILISGGKPSTIHADSRYQVQEILSRSPAIAAVDGAFFSLKYLDSNIIIGPVYSQSTGEFIPGNASENRLLAGRPLVLIGSTKVQFLPFNPDMHSTHAGIQAEMQDVTDAFVAAAWLVKDGLPRSKDSFGTLFGFDVPRHRAFWGIDVAGRPVIGVSQARVDSVTLGELLVRSGFRDAVMLDSGASTSLAFQGESLIEGYEPRPVPHVVALMPPTLANAKDCALVLNRAPGEP